MNKTQHLLLLMMEECAEVAHCCSKAMRFGLNAVQEGQELNKAERIAAELTDLFAVVRMLEEETGHILILPSPEAVRAKREKVEKHMNISHDLGQLEEESDGQGICDGPSHGGPC